MAKKQVSPQLFRAGITQSWPTTVKLENYNLNFYYAETVQNQLSDYWCNRTVRKLILSHDVQFEKELQKITKQKAVPLSHSSDITRMYLQILKKRIESRRRGLLFRVTLARLCSVNGRRARFLYPRVEYWYKKLYKGLAKKRNIIRSAQPFLRDEKQILWYRNYMNMEILQFQNDLRVFLRGAVVDARTSVAGSTVLRRYQCNIAAIQPPFWTRAIRLNHASFKKIVGYVKTWRPEPGLSYRYLVLLSQMNLALQWRSGFLFVHLIKNMFEQHRRVQGSLRLVHELLNRMNLSRYNILCIKMKIIGSFGKITRSKTVKLGKIARGVSHSVTNLNQPVSYASTQVWTIRGILGLRVWIFW